MNYATFAALTNYDTAAAAIAANPTNGTAWLLNETKIFKDGRMGNPRANNTDENTYKKGSQRQKARTLSLTIQRNKGAANKTGSTYLSTKGGGGYVNRVTRDNSKTASIRHKVSWYVTDSTNDNGYRKVEGLLEDPSTTSPYRDDDAQVRK